MQVRHSSSNSGATPPRSGRIGAERIRPLRGGVAPAHWYLLPICLLACLSFAWFDTIGGWDFFRPEILGTYYDAQAHGLLHGRFDVPKSAIAPEAFIRDGKYYGYFGIAPALPRILLNAVWPRMYGRWSRLSMMLACIVNVLLVCRLAVLADNSAHADPPARWRKFCIGLFALSATVGSTNLFLASRAHVFHEAVIWGSALALACGSFAIRYVLEERRSDLMLAGICAVSAFFCRATAGAGALGLLLLLAGKTWRKTRGDAAISLAFVAAAVALYFSITYAKFHSFDGVPVRLYQQYIDDPARMQITGGRQIHPENLRAGLYNFFTLAPPEMHRGFPWLFMNYRPTVFPETKMDYFERYCSIPAGEPALALLALIGVFAILLWHRGSIGTFGLPALAMFLGGSVVLLTVGISERYMHDFYPFLVIAGAAGAARIGAVKWPIGRWVLGGVLVPLAVFGVCANTAFALDWQRTAAHGTPQSHKDQYRAWQSSVDSLVSRCLEKL
ncbi:MAG TPA: hypothetical protein VHY37_02800 [Tepidisphaeraceae bacterium]|nr:hypothetical protein [Tepidisphaeraceae bacterium]